jgi:Adenylylsulphate kinase
MDRLNSQPGKSTGDGRQRQAVPEDGVSRGHVFWITGLSGAGKTTVGRELWRRLRAAGRPVTFLDGDTLRSVMAEDLSHSAGDRRRSAAKCTPVPTAGWAGRRCRLRDHLVVSRSATCDKVTAAASFPGFQGRSG